MKIAFYSSIRAFPWGGADSLWTRAAEAAMERGDTLQIVVSEKVAGHPRMASLSKNGASLVIARQPKPVSSLAERVQRKVKSLVSPHSAVADLKSFNPDLVVISCGGTYDLVIEPELTSFLLTKRVPFRLIANWQTENPSIEEADRVLARSLFQAADALFFVSARNLEATRRHLVAELPNAVVLHNPLRWVPSDRPGPLLSTPWRLATVGRLTSVKGVHLALQAASMALPKGEDWRLSIYGEGPAEPWLREVASHLGIGQRVQFKGYVPGLREIWESNHILISPALDEGVPMTIPEAMLCERPVIATNVGGAEEWIEPSVTGFLAPAATASILADTLRLAWSERHRWTEMGKNAAVSAGRTYRPADFNRVVESIHPAT